MKKNILCLIIDSVPDEAWRATYETHRANWNKCLDRSPNIEGYFLYADPTLQSEYRVNKRSFTIRGEERHDTIFDKTRVAIKTLLDKHDFVIRTNISSMWDFPLLKKQKFSEKRLYTGYTWPFNPPFVTGSGMIMSRDVAKKLRHPPTSVLHPADDVAIAQVLLASGIHPQHRSWFAYDYLRGLDQIAIGKCFHYRLRDLNDPVREQERAVSDYLFNKLYGHAK